MYGTRLYGKVDHAPGLFYVATTFFYINFVPLVPTGSFLVIDDGTEKNGVKISLSPWSMLVGWGRAIGFVAGPILLLIGLFDDNLDAAGRLGFAAGGVGLFAAAVTSYWLMGIGRDRAARLAEQAGLDPAFVHDHFDELEGKPPAERPRNDGLYSPDMDEAMRRWNSGQKSDDRYE
jgi:hypothetical protein